MLASTLADRPSSDPWSGKPEIYTLGDPTSDVAVVFLTGAFNSGWMHVAELAELFTRVGRLYVVEYSPLYFDTEKTLEAIYEKLDGGMHNKVLLIGASLGGKVALQFAEYDATHERRYVGNTKIIVSDAALDYNQLPWLARFSLKMSPGPVANALSSWLITRIMFRTFKKDMLSPGTNMTQLSLHMAGMWRMKTSGMVSQIAAVARPVVFKRIAGIPTVYLQCNRDTVIKNPEARAAWETLGLDWRGVISVDSEHVAFVEHYSEWFARFVEAIQLLDLKIHDFKLAE